MRIDAGICDSWNWALRVYDLPRGYYCKKQLLIKIPKMYCFVYWGKI